MAWTGLATKNGKGAGSAFARSSGAGGGIAATFNTPLGGVMFAIEMMMPEVGTRTFVPVALATGAATFVSRVFLGSEPAFHLPSFPEFSYDATLIVVLLLYGVLGVLIVLVVPADTAFDQFLEQTGGDNAVRHLVVTEKDKICGVQTVDAAFRHGLRKSPTDLKLADIVKREFAIAQRDDTIFQVLRRMHDQKADMAVVVKGTGVWTGMPSGDDVLGVISKDQVATSVIDSIVPYFTT